jgi:hypothetical protein
MRILELAQERLDEVRIAQHVVQLADVLDGIRVAQVSLEDCPVSLIRYALAADLREQVNRQVHDMVRHAATGLESIFSNLKRACSHELAQHLASGRKDPRTITRVTVPEIPRLEHAGASRRRPCIRPRTALDLSGAHGVLEWHHNRGHRHGHVQQLPPLAAVDPPRGAADRSLDATPRA